MTTKLVLVLAALLLIGLQAAPAWAQEQPWQGASVLDDPQWRKRFLASYGVLSGAEPQIREVEREGLREVLALMETDPKAAAARLEQQIGPESSAALDFILANLRFQTGEVELARRAYRGALDKFPDFRRAHKNLGLLLVQEQRFAEAAEHLSRALELGDRDGRNYGLLGYCHLNLEDYLPAEEAYRNAVLQEPGNRDWKLGLARSLLAMEKYSEAVALFDRLLASDPEEATFWMLQANAYLGLERPREAAVNLETVRAMGQAQTSTLVLLGDIYMNEALPDLAKSAYLEVIAVDEGAARFDTAYRAADLLVRSANHEQAREILASIQERYEGELTSEQELDVLTLRARVARAQGRDEEAAKLLATIVRRDGTRGEALLELASYHRAQGDTDRALLLIERAQRLEEFEYDALLEHVKIAVTDKDYRKAAELLRRALDIKREPRVERFLARVEQAVRPE